MRYIKTFNEARVDGGFGPVELTFDSKESYDKAIDLFTKLDVDYFVISEDNNILSIKGYHMKNIAPLLEENMIKYKTNK